MKELFLVRFVFLFVPVNSSYDIRLVPSLRYEIKDK